MAFARITFREVASSVDIGKNSSGSADWHAACDHQLAEVSEEVMSTPQ
jgi:hypothetical protein